MLRMAPQEEVRGIKFDVVRGSRASGVAEAMPCFAGSPYNYPRAAIAKPMAIVPQHMPATKTSRTIANVIAHPPSKRGN
jgi:hypothetical protein